MEHCFLCPFALESVHVFDNDNQHFRILSFINCKSKNIIFCIYCSICGPISVSFTSKELSSVYLDLLHTIKCDPFNALSLHFYQANHSVNNFFIQGLQSINSNSFPYTRIIIWVHRLKTFNFLDHDIFVPKIFRLKTVYSQRNAFIYKHLSCLF